MLEIKNAVFGYTGKQKNKTVLEDISFRLERGELMCILGANGAGKTTMYRTILGFLPLLEGQILIDGEDIRQLPREMLSKKIAYVQQYHTPPFAYSVFDVVLMGRGTHISRLSSPGETDKAIAYQMLERMGLIHLKDENYTEISGGERQLVLIARALAQQTDYILMDEPAASLDFGNQLRLLVEIKKLTGEGKGVCFTSHDPDHAFLAGASVLAVTGRNRCIAGPADKVVTRELLAEMYGIDAQVSRIQTESGRTVHRVVVDDMETLMRE